MRKLFELNLDFNLWYKNQLRANDIIDRSDRDEELYKSGLIILIYSLTTAIVIISLSGLFIISCLINFIYYFLKDYYKKQAKIKREKLVKVRIVEWIEYYEKMLKTFHTLKLASAINDNEKFMARYGCTIGVKTKDLDCDNFKNIFKKYDERFILKFLRHLNHEFYTVNSVTNHVTCRLNARRSINDIYLIVKYYFPEITFEQVLKDIVTLYELREINGSFCNDVRFYVFYTDRISQTRNSTRDLEFISDLTFKDLINYFNNK